MIVDPGASSNAEGEFSWLTRNNQFINPGSGDRTVLTELSKFKE
jgi:hypothetical protein